MLSRVIILFLGLIMTCMMYVSPVEVQAQQELACGSGIGNPVGFLRIPRAGEADPAVGVDFSASVIQTFEATPNGVTGGTDNAVEIIGPAYNTLIADYQVVTHWRVSDGFNTYVTVVNSSDIAEDISVHIHILGEDCIEEINFCDTYTPNDSHTYDLSDIVTDAGVPFGPVSGEGIMTITPATNCGQGDTSLGTLGTYRLSADVNIVSADVDLGAGTFMRAQPDPGDPPQPDQEGDADAAGVIIAEYNSQNTAAGDIIFINLADGIVVDPQAPTVNNYFPRPANSVYFPILDFDDEEISRSCGEITACYARVGINTELVGSDDFDPVLQENCSAAGDEDMNGAADCADSACAGETGPSGETCEPGGETSCSDGQDNDGDGATDCADSSCDSAAGAGCEGDADGDCSDGVDNDGDGNTDCDDAACDAAANCQPTTGGGGGGCTVVSGTTAGTAAVNFLLPLLAVGFAFMLRRRQS